ncbi:MAG: radical SAM protein [Candidatus Thermoplasmatota archaeon]|nr:radical SAM protein [Candidatus Thermoplasmatota archaeon]
MKINEIFYSIQGEGKQSGQPTIFIRITGCNLRCSFCDTAYAYYEGTEMTISQILERIKTYPCKEVCVTGGEPLLQEGLIELLNALLKKSYRVTVETNGSILITPIIENISNIMMSLDIKCPSSGMQNDMQLGNLKVLRKDDQLKCVISNKTDYEFAKNILETYKPSCQLFFQPVWGSDPKKLAKWMLNDGIQARLGVQLHKILWGNAKGK